MVVTPADHPHHGANHEGVGKSWTLKYGEPELDDRDDRTSVLERWDREDKCWKRHAKIPYATCENRLELSIGLETLGLPAKGFTVDFKWADNPKDIADIISICTTGDTAPNRRFNYRFTFKAR